MYICPICNNDSFEYVNSDDGLRLAICTVCGEDFIDDEDDEDEVEEYYQ